MSESANSNAPQPTETDAEFEARSAEFGQTPDFNRLLPAFQRLCEVVARLRSPSGCPWDRRQTLKTIKPYTLEETYELLDAIDADDNAGIQEELGDVLLQVILDAQIATDEKRFALLDVVEQITNKLVDRHPHVFGDESVETVDDVKAVWSTQKSREKNRDSLLDGIPATLPQLARTVKLSKRAASVGYDWPDRLMLFGKLQEELDELAEELFADGTIPDVDVTVETEVVSDEPITDPARLSRAESEIGDILFVVANIARRWGINPEEALRRSNAKFARRFQGIEQALTDRLAEASLIEMEEAYQAAKKQHG